MEEAAGRRWSSCTRKKKKRRKEASPPPDHTFFPILISSYFKLNICHARKMVYRLLRNHLAFVRSGKGGPILPPGLISLLPLLLNQKKKNSVIAVLAAEIVGAIALCSLESNEEVASDSTTVRMLVANLGSRSKAVATAACHAILDLSAAPLSREQLRKSLAVEKLFFCPNILQCDLLQGRKKHLPTRIIIRHYNLLILIPIDLLTSGRSVLCQVAAGRTGTTLPSPFLDAAMMLINTCNNTFLENIPGKTTIRFLPLAKKSRIDCRDKRRSSELAETIFRLSMNQDSFTYYPHDLLRTMIFGKEEHDFEKFILSHWENSPIKLYNRSEEDFFSSLFNFGSGSLDPILDFILKGSISCPPLASDELDILSFLEEVNGSLGSDLVNGQDIRLVKTKDLESGSKEEVNFLAGDVLAADQILSTCKEAMESGYTVALRGLEFRSMEIAGISEGLASVFGQPSVGVNAYLTPAESQGLCRHFDDHCVFICQLWGMKRWVVSSRSTPLLPRLYEDLGVSSREESGGGCGVEREFVLQKGDILYIPRGCPHEASTIGIDKEDQLGTPTFSLHLTLGIEVEPPFEWEGFMHVALHCWSQNQTQNHPCLVVNLFHMAIELTSVRIPLLRKACLLLSTTHHSKSQNPKSIFTGIISSIESLTSFAETLKKIKQALSEHNSLFFHRFRWLRHLPSTSVDFDEPFEAFKELLTLTEGETVDLEGKFAETKYQFCRSVDFEDSRKELEMIQRRYKKVRRQYMNGMLSLKSTS